MPYEKLTSFIISNSHGQLSSAEYRAPHHWIQSVQRGPSAVKSKFSHRKFVSQSRLIRSFIVSYSTISTRSRASPSKGDIWRRKRENCGKFPGRLSREVKSEEKKIINRQKGKKSKSSGNQMNSSVSSAVRALSLEYKSLQEEPVEGFRVKVNEENLFEWHVSWTKSFFFFPDS